MFVFFFVSGFYNNNINNNCFTRESKSSMSGESSSHEEEVQYMMAEVNSFLLCVALISHNVYPITGEKLLQSHVYRV